MFDIPKCAVHIRECVLPCLFALMCLQKILLYLHGGDRPISTQVAVQLSEPNKMAEVGPAGLVGKMLGGFNLHTIAIWDDHVASLTIATIAL